MAAGTQQLTDKQVAVLRKLAKAETPQRRTQVASRDDLTALIEQGYVRELGGDRVGITRNGIDVVEAAKSNGRRAANDILGGAALETLAAIARGTFVSGRGQGLTLAKLRDLDYIKMGERVWEATALGLQRLAREGVPVGVPVPPTLTVGDAAQAFAAQAAEDVPLDAGDGSPAEPEDYSAEDAGEPAYDGDPCPQCGSQNTARIDVISSDPDVWHCECGGCGAFFEVISGGVLVNEDAFGADAEPREATPPEVLDEIEAHRVDPNDAPETTVLVNGVQFTLDMPADMTVEDVRERVIQAIQGALSPTQIAAVAMDGSAPALLTADYFDFAAGDEGIASALVSRAAHDGCDCATPCLHRRVLDELMAISPTARALYDTEAAKDALRARLRDV